MNEITTNDIYEYVYDLMHITNMTTYKFYDAEDFELFHITLNEAIDIIVEQIYKKNDNVTKEVLEDLTDGSLIDMLMEKEIRAI